MDGWIPVLVEVTAYCPCVKCCGRMARGITADGSPTTAHPYNLAGDIYSFRLGDEVFIPLGYGALDSIRWDNRVFIVDDRGEALNTDAREAGLPRLDLRVREHWWAKQFGRKRIIIFIRQR
jgi:3D (Asp-Asp-Asp) domain-containing protein